MNNQKQDCADQLFRRIGSTARFRRGKSQEYPEDTRNVRAADALDQLANEIRLSDIVWQQLAPYFDPHSPRWLTAVSRTCADVGFRRNPASFDDFARQLIANLGAKAAA